MREYFPTHSVRPALPSYPNQTAIAQAPYRQVSRGHRYKNPAGNMAAWGPEMEKVNHSPRSSGTYRSDARLAQSKPPWTSSPRIHRKSP